MSRSVSGFNSIIYALKIAKTVGFKNYLKSIKSKNACKTCAFGMGGQKGGMVNESGNYPEICKKSMQAQLTDIQGPIPENVFNTHTFDNFSSIPPRKLERLGRLNTPLINMGDNDYLSPVHWDDAQNVLSTTFKNISPERTFFYSSGRSSNEAAFLLQIFARAYGTNNINNCSYYCHQASGVGLSETIGSGTATIVLEDVKKADMIFVIGANPSSNHPRLMRELLHCRRRGGEVIIINPLMEPGLKNFTVPSDLRSLIMGDNKIATLYIQPRIGGDIALLKGVSKAVIESKNIHNDFIKKYTSGFEDYSSDVLSTSWADIEKTSGVNRKKIEKLAKLYAKAENVVFSWCMGITHHKHGVNNVESIVNLALIRGMVGRNNAGLLPLRGHSNVQGIGSMGMTPSLKKSVLENLEKKLGISTPNCKGMDTLQCLRAAEEGKIDAAFIMGGNLYGASPDSEFAKQALSKIPFKVFLTTTLNQGHFRGRGKNTLILPVLARDEELQATTQESMFNFIRMSDGGCPRLNNVRSEVEIIAQMAESIVGTGLVDFSAFRKHRNIREAIGHIVPGFNKLITIDDTKEEFHISRRTFHKPLFPTSNGKAFFTTVPIPKMNLLKGQFYMASIRSEGQFNTIIYEDVDTFRNVSDRWVVLMNSTDMQELQLKDGDCVNIKNDTGIMQDVHVKSYLLPSGNIATYFPESNVLIPAIPDSQSQTPAYKSAIVTIFPAT